MADSLDRRARTDRQSPVRKRYHELRAAGMCVKDCGTPVRGRSYCHSCVDKQLLHNHRSILRKYGVSLVAPRERGF